MNFCLTRIKWPGYLGAPRFLAEHRALQGHPALMTMKVLMKGLLISWSADDLFCPKCVIFVGLVEAQTFLSL